ncbi:MAG: phosphatidate cytidylyltransferase, partial [Muribaculaceae bacterium]|nr:phosphatidate cytidylyltransferase [Muribaculaceae bacterium]
MDIKKLITRALSGLIYVAVIVGCVLWGDPGITLLGIAFAILAGLELRNIFKHNQSSKGQFIFSFLDILGIALLSVTFNPRIPFIPVLLWVAVVIARFVAQLYDKDSDPLKELSHSMFAQIYLGLPLAAMGMAAFLFSPYLVLTVFLMLWISDTGAYLVGSMMGKRRLIERISPNKSWEGLF